MIGRAPSGSVLAFCYVLSWGSAPPARCVWSRCHDETALMRGGEQSDAAIRDAMRMIADTRGFEVRGRRIEGRTGSPASKREAISCSLDIKMPGMDGLRVLDRLKAKPAES